MENTEIKYGPFNPEICVEENKVYSKTNVLLDEAFHYCPGCGHATVHKILAEVIEEMGIEHDIIGVAPVGCSVFAYNYLNVDIQQAAHGRACALGTAIRRLFPDKYVFTYQGDGDLTAIGGNETIHAANRGENMLCIFINNGIYGMTSGQMAPTTLEGMVTTTTPHGRDVKVQGYPLRIANLLKELPGVAYITRQSVHTPANVRKTKKAIKQALEYQKQNKGFCMVEIVSNCPSNLKLTPLKSNKFVAEQMIPFYPLGDIKVPEVK